MDKIQLCKKIDKDINTIFRAHTATILNSVTEETLLTNLGTYMDITLEKYTEKDTNTFTNNYTFSINDIGRGIISLCIIGRNNMSPIDTERLIDKYIK